MILLSGATGRTGRHLVDLVIGAGIPVRAIVRDAAKAEALRARGAEVVTGDLRDRALVERAMRGSDRAVLATANAPEQRDIDSGFIDAAISAGVAHVVKLSAIDADPHSQAVLKRFHGEAEERLKASGLAYTILQANFFTDNLLGLAPGIARDSTLALPMGTGRVAPIDVRDVAEAQFMVLTRPGHESRTWELSGPQLLTFADIAAVLSAELGREIRYVDQPPDDFRRQMLALGVPEWNVDAMLGLFALIREDRNARVTDHFEAIAGCPPRPLNEFVRDHRDRFG